MAGSGVSYAWRSGLWALASLVTLGLALPWAKASLERYKMRHTSYGDLQGRFDGTGWALFKKVWWLWLLIWPSFVIPIALPFVYAAMRAIEWRWWIAGLSLGKVGFSSDLRNGALIGLYWKVIGWCVLLFVALGAWFGAVMAVAYQSIGTNVPAQQKFLLASQKLPVLLELGFGYIVVVLAMGLIIRIYLMRDLWQRVAESVTVQNLEAAGNVTAQGELVSALGEGFANSLDIAGF